MPDGSRVADAKHKPFRRRINGAGHPMELHRIGHELTLLSDFGGPLMCPALDEDGEVLVGAVQLNPRPGRVYEASRAEGDSEPLREAIQHDSLGGSLLM